MKFSRMNLSVVAVIAMVLLQALMINAQMHGNSFSGCPCETFAVLGKHGRLVGNCQTPDNTGYKFCYIQKDCPNCEGQSTVFPEKCKSYAKCRIVGFGDS